MQRKKLGAFQFFGSIVGVAALIVRTLEFDPLVISPCDESDLRETFAAIDHRTLKRADPLAFVFPGIVVMVQYCFQRAMSFGF